MILPERFAKNLQSISEVIKDMKSMVTIKEDKVNYLLFEEIFRNSVCKKHICPGCKVRYNL